jgi:hypothetical protein
MSEHDTDAQDYGRPLEPNPDLKNLDRLVGMWEMSGEVQGRVTFEWMEGGFFLIQHVDLGQHGQRIKGIEVIGHERPFGAEPSEDIRSRFYSNTGDTLDYVYELEGTTSRSGPERRVPQRTPEARSARTVTWVLANGCTRGAGIGSP